MISTDGGSTAQLLPLNAALFNCFDPIDEEDTDNAGLLDEDKPKKAPETVFYGTGYGSDTFEVPEAIKKKKKTATKKKEKEFVAPFDDKISDEQRVEFYTRAYDPSDFDKTPRPQWMTKAQAAIEEGTTTLDADLDGGFINQVQYNTKLSQLKDRYAANDNQKRKHSFPALDEARNNTLMVGRDRADTLIQNEWAMDILVEVADLLDASAPKSAWSQHNGHGETDEHAIEDNANPGYGIDAKHDYGPSVKKVKKLWEHGNDNEPSKECRVAESLGYVPQWNLGTTSPDPDDKSIDGYLTDTVMSSPETGKPRWTRVLRNVGKLDFNEFGTMTHFRNKKGKKLKFKTRTRAAKGPKDVPDPIDIRDYGGAAMPRNKKGELTAGFFGGKTGSSNSIKPDTLDYEPITGPSNSSNDPWAAQRAGPGCLNRISASISGASAGFRLPSGVAVG
jgi:hypothetical protein